MAHAQDPYSDQAVEEYLAAGNWPDTNALIESGFMAPTPTSPFTRRLAARWMVAQVANYMDAGEVDASILAQDCAYELGHADWTYDEEHPVWELAREVAENYEERRWLMR